MFSNKYKFLYINQEALKSDFVLKSDYFLYKKNNFRYNHFSGVYVRLASPSARLKDLYPNIEFDLSVLLNVINTKFSNIVNTTISQATNYSKLYQLIKSNVKKIKIPESYVISNINLSSLPLDSKLVYKSLSSIRSTPTLLDQYKNFDNLPNEPVLFQHFVNGHNIRVHVVKNTCFSSLILTEKVDYRYDHASLKVKYDLPKDIQEECINLTKQFGLKISGIDLIKLNSDFYLLEINPSPGYCTFEYNYEISKKLTEVLITG